MEKDFSLLVSKTLSGEADEQEKNLLRDMLRDSETDVALYNQIHEYWNADVKVDETLSAATQQKILEVIAAAQRRYRRREFVLWFYRVAAVFLLASVGGMYYYFTVNEQHIYTYATQDAIADYVLQDGTKIKLNKNSFISFNSSFGQKDRTVFLTGEAYFEVNYDSIKPFKVFTQGTETQVKGTKFNILSDEVDKQVAVTLVEGSVHFKAEGCNDLLRPHETIVYHAGTAQYTKQTTDLQFNTAWMEGRYFYRHIAFGELLKKLEHIYQVRIEMNYPEIASRHITTSFLTDRPLYDILSALQGELKFDFKEIDDKQFIISKIKTTQ